MLTPPAGLADRDVLSALASHWHLTATAIAYQSVGWGSHHWLVSDARDVQWFVTADDLDAKRFSPSEPFDPVFARLRAALWAATGLREHGRGFVVAPVPTLAGETLVRVGERFSLAVYPFVSGRSFGWGEFSDSGHRQAVLGMIVGVHAAPEPVTRRAQRDDFAIQRRADLDSALDSLGAGPAGWDRPGGPYTHRAAVLMAENAVPVRDLLARYDALLERVRSRALRAVLTHGEPHPGNTMLTDDGWRLIDWDTALVAPPERDLWGLDPGDGSVLAAYAAATGVTPNPEALELYRIRWDLTDIALDSTRLLREHSGSDDDAKTWAGLRSLVAHVSAPGYRRDGLPSAEL
jgi:hypothetical protein